MTEALGILSHFDYMLNLQCLILSLKLICLRQSCVVVHTPWLFMNFFEIGLIYIKLCFRLSVNICTSGLDVGGLGLKFRKREIHS